MLPIVRTPSAVACRKYTQKLVPLQAVASDGETLTGEWQGARSGQSRAKRGRVFDSEVYSDNTAVHDYLSVADELPTVTVGQLLSVYA